MPQASQRMQIGVEYMENSCPLARQEGSSRAAEPSALTTACSLQQQQFRDTSSAPLHRELAQAVSIAIMSRLSNSVLSRCVVTLQIRWVTAPVCTWERTMSCWSILASFGGLSCLPMKHTGCVARDIATSLVVNRKFRKHVHRSFPGIQGQSVGLRTSYW